MQLYTLSNAYQRLLKTIRERLTFFWCHYRHLTYRQWMTLELLQGINKALGDKGLPHMTSQDCDYEGFYAIFNWKNQLTNLEVIYSVDPDSPYYLDFCYYLGSDQYPLGGLDLSGIRMSPSELNCEDTLEGIIDITIELKELGLI